MTSIIVAHARKIGDRILLSATKILTKMITQTEHIMRLTKTCLKNQFNNYFVTHADKRNGILQWMPFFIKKKSEI